MSNLIYTTLTLGGTSPAVNLDEVIQVSKTGSTFVGSNGNPSLPQSRFGILFTLSSPGQNVQQLTWRYASQAVRDADYDLIMSENAIELGNAPEPEA